MRLSVTILSILSLAAIPAFCQEPVAAITGDQPVIALYGRIVKWAVRLEPMLGQVKPQEWAAKGASETYGKQADGVAAQLKGIAQEMTELQSRPDTLQDGMKALFRVQAFNRSLNSVLAGLRKYQNPALADLIVSVASEGTSDFQALEDHLLEVASQRETEYLVVEHEAQRCRGELTRQPVPARPPRKPVQ